MKRKIIKISILVSFSFALLIGLGINYSDQEGLKIKSGMQAFADDPGLYKDDWKDCSANGIIFEENGPVIVDVPGKVNSCLFQWAAHCDQVRCSPLAPE